MRCVFGDVFLFIVRCGDAFRTFSCDTKDYLFASYVFPRSDES